MPSKVGALLNEIDLSLLIISKRMRLLQVYDRKPQPERKLLGAISVGCGWSHSQLRLDGYPKPAVLVWAQGDGAGGGYHWFRTNYKMPKFIF